MAKIQMRRGTTTQWSTANPVLAAGEPGRDVTLKRTKTGDGSTAWTALPWDAPSNAELAANYAPLWQPNTAYLAGALAVSPTSGQVGTAKADFTSGSTYDPSKWNLATGGTTTVDGLTDATTVGKAVAKAADAAAARTAIGATHVPKVVDTSEVTAEWGVIDSAGRAPIIARTDGSIEIPFARIAGAETVNQTNDAYLKATIVGGRVLEDAIGPDGRVPQWVLDAWEERRTPINKDVIKIVVVAGQSNATSADILPNAVEEADSRLLMWDPATLAIITAPQASAFLGTYFGRTWLEKYANQRILIVPCGAGETAFTTSSITPSTPSGYTYAVNGTWDRTLTADTKNLYAQMIARTQAAKAAVTALGFAGEIVGVLWSQGEGDSNTLNQAQYAAKLDDLIAQTRTDLGLSTLPFVIGSLVPERGLAPSNSIPTYFNEIVAALQDTPRRVLRTAYSPGPPDMFKYNQNRIHWSAAGQRVRGRDFVQALFRARINVAASEPQPPNHLTIRRSGTEAIVDWVVPECRAAAFNLQTSVDTGATWVTQSLPNPLDTRFTLTAAAGTPVWARVRTVNDVATSDYTTEVHG